MSVKRFLRISKALGGLEEGVGPLVVVSSRQERNVFVGKFSLKVLPCLWIIGLMGDEDPFSMSFCLLCDGDMWEKGSHSRRCIGSDHPGEVVIKGVLG